MQLGSQKRPMRVPHPPHKLMTQVPISGPLFEARFVQRLNRFLLQVRLSDTSHLTQAHIADPGRLRELLLPEKRVWLRAAAKPGRKTEWTAVLAETPDGESLVSLDTTLPNRLIGAALKDGAMEELCEWAYERAEFPLGRSRLDFLLSRGEGDRLALEVKSVTLVEDGVAFFPDAVTERGARHLRELAEISEWEGWAAAVLFVLQRSDAREIRAARSIDRRFAEALEEARDAGVRVLGRRCQVYPNRMVLGPPIPVVSDI